MGTELCPCFIQDAVLHKTASIGVELQIFARGVIFSSIMLYADHEVKVGTSDSEYIALLRRRVVSPGIETIRITFIAARDLPRNCP